MAREFAQFLSELEARHPHEVVRVRREIRPAEFEVTALLQHLENEKRFPMLVFERPSSVAGAPSGMPLVSNVFANRERCAVALGLSPERTKNELGLCYAEGEKRRISPTVVGRDASPAKQVIRREGEVSLLDYPIVRHHEMDPAPYIDMTVVTKDPEEGFYNVSFQRTMLQGPRQLGIMMAPRHNLFIARKYEQAKRPVPVVIVAGHHPAFYLGSLNLLPFGTDDYEVLGGFLGEPLRLTASETWGGEFLVPADAEVLIEGEMIPWERDAEAPFGEYTGYYGPQRHLPIVRVRAVTQRREPYFQHTFVGHRDVSILGGIPKEGGLLNAVKGVVPSVRAVHLPTSGRCRFYAFLSLQKTYEGAPKQAALTALAHCDFIKICVVVDEDIDVFDEEEVWWAVATRSQPAEDFDVLRNVKGSILDPSVARGEASSKVIIDATKPITHPFASRVRVPGDVLARIRVRDFLEG